MAADLDENDSDSDSSVSASRKSKFLNTKNINPNMHNSLFSMLIFPLISTFSHLQCACVN